MSKRRGYYVPVSMSDAMREALRHPMAFTIPSEWACGPDLSIAFSYPTGDASCSGDIGDAHSPFNQMLFLRFEDELREAYRG